MLFLTTLALLTASTLAAPAPQTPSSPPPPQQILPPGYSAPWAWHISGWEAGCSRSGCSYNFNVSVPTKGPPSSSASSSAASSSDALFYCNGYENGEYGFDNYFSACQVLDTEGTGYKAAARLRRRVNGDFPRVIEVGVLVPGFENQIHPYNFTAYGNVTYNRSVAPPIAFDVFPTVWQQLPYPGTESGN